MSPKDLAADKMIILSHTPASSPTHGTLSACKRYEDAATIRLHTTSRNKTIFDIRNECQLSSERLGCLNDSHGSSSFGCTSRTLGTHGAPGHWPEALIRLKGHEDEDANKVSGS